MSVNALDQVLKSPRLPTLPAIAWEVVNLVSDPDVDVQVLANTLSKDPALSAKILKTVNSSYYAQSKPVSTMRQAVIFLGLNSLKTMALGFSLVSNLKQPHENGFDDTAFWKRSLYTAVAARTIANKVQMIDDEEAFMAGLLSDLGVLALEQVLGEQYHEILLKTGGQASSLAKFEQEALKTDHAEVGGALADLWKLPPPLSETIRWHEQPDEADAIAVPLARCVALGNRIADIYMGDEQSQAIAGAELAEMGKRWFDLNEVDLHELITSAAGNAAEVKKLFELPIADLEPPDVILARANETLMQMTIQVQQQTALLQQQNEALSQQATLDPLTRIANRGMFDQFVAETFKNCKEKNETASLLMIDTDHFKRFNDRFGHQVGDRVLVSQANLMNDLTPSCGLAARYGGEEFAIVLPGKDLATARNFAEQVRSSVMKIAMRSEDQCDMQISVSIGVATMSDRCFKDVESWIRAADRSVYEAKANGRNRVECHEPNERHAAA